MIQKSVNHPWYFGTQAIAMYLASSLIVVLQACAVSEACMLIAFFWVIVLPIGLKVASM
jgi:hypothetical protein